MPNSIQVVQKRWWFDSSKLISPSNVGTNYSCKKSGVFPARNVKRCEKHLCPIWEKAANLLFTFRFAQCKRGSAKFSSVESQVFCRSAIKPYGFFIVSLRTAKSHVYPHYYGVSQIWMYRIPRPHKSPLQETLIQLLSFADPPKSVPVPELSEPIRRIGFWLLFFQCKNAPRGV